METLNNFSCRLNHAMLLAFHDEFFPNGRTFPLIIVIARVIISQSMIWIWKREQKNLIQFNISLYFSLFSIYRPITSFACYFPPSSVCQISTIFSSLYISTVVSFASVSVCFELIVERTDFCLVKISHAKTFFHKHFLVAAFC